MRLDRVALLAELGAITLTGAFTLLFQTGCHGDHRPADACVKSAAIGFGNNTSSASEQSNIEPRIVSAFGNVSVCIDMTDLASPPAPSTYFGGSCAGFYQWPDYSATATANCQGQADILHAYGSMYRAQNHPPTYVVLYMTSDYAPQPAENTFELGEFRRWTSAPESCFAVVYDPEVERFLGGLSQVGGYDANKLGLYKRNTMFWVEAHELGHQMGLTDSNLEQFNHSLITGCIMYQVDQYQIVVYVSDPVFCSDNDTDNTNSCKDNLQRLLP